jgi:quinol monooxygenase YgiN
MAEFVSMLSIPPLPQAAGATQDVAMPKTNVTVALYARLVARPGKEEEVAAFLRAALPLAVDEPTTTVWFGVRLGPSEFGVFDAFPDDRGRQAHLTGPIAQALMAKAPELFAEPPEIRPLEVLAAKL